MDHIKTSFTQRMATKRLAHQSIGAFLVTRAKQWVQYPKELQGYVRRNVLTLKVDPAEDMTKLYLEKQHILAGLQAALEEFGYDYTLRDMRFQIRSSH